jgi:histone acetyltransferase 1
LILPPLQGGGHGGRFYDIIFTNARSDPQIQEISIEDPSAKFEDLRDRRDLNFLESQGVFNNVKAPVSKSWIEDTRKTYKMPPVFPEDSELISETVSKSDGDGIIERNQSS